MKLIQLAFMSIYNYKWSSFFEVKKNENILWISRFKRLAWINLWHLERCWICVTQFNWHEMKCLWKGKNYTIPQNCNRSFSSSLLLLILSLLFSVEDLWVLYIDFIECSFVNKQLVFILISVYTICVSVRLSLAHTVYVCVHATWYDVDASEFL